MQGAACWRSSEYGSAAVEDQLEVLARSQHPHAAEEVCLVYVIIVCSVVLSMYVCMYVFISIHICLFSYVYICIYMCVYTCIYGRGACAITTSTRCRRGVFSIRYNCMFCCTFYVCMYVSIYIYLYLFIFICVYTYIYVYLYTCICSRCLRARNIHTLQKRCVYSKL